MGAYKRPLEIINWSRTILVIRILGPFPVLIGGTGVNNKREFQVFQAL